MVAIPAGSASFTNGHYELKNSTGLLEGLTRLDCSAEVADLPGLMAILTAGSTPLPLSVTTGKLTAKASLSRSGRTTTIQVPDWKGTSLTVLAGGQPLLDGEVSAGGTLAFDTGAGGNLDAVRISDLHASLGTLGTLTLPEPFTISELEKGTPTVAGAFRAAGAIGPTFKLVSAFGNIPSSATMAGDYVLTQKIATDSGKLRATGDLSLVNFQVSQAGQLMYADAKVDATDDVELDPAARTLGCNTLKVTPSSGAFVAAMKGRVMDWMGARQLDQVTADLDYDWSKFWPVVQVWLPADERAALKDVKIAGQHHSSFDIRGSLPAGADPLRTLIVSGVISAASIDDGSYSFHDITLPVLVQNASVRTVYPDGHLAAPMAFNGGTLDMGDISADLSGATPRYTLPRNKSLLTDVKMDVPLANDLLARYCPLFAGARQAEGRLSVTVSECTNVALEELNQPGGSARGQRVDLQASVTGLQVAGTLTDVLQPLLEAPGLAAPATMRNGRFLIQDGQVSGDFSVHLTAANSDLSLKSTVRLADHVLMPMTVIVPKNLLPAARNAGPAALANLPDKVEIGFDGTTEHPQPRLDSLTRLIQSAAAKAIAPAATPAH